MASGPPTRSNTTMTAPTATRWNYAFDEANGAFTARFAKADSRAWVVTTTDPDSAFWGWNDVWLSPDFRAWSIEEEIRAIRCPLLAMQGVDDEYGTLEQVRGIARRVPQAQLLEIPRCGHSPHKDQPEVVIEAVRAFVAC